MPAHDVVQSARETVAPVFSKVNSAAKQQYSKALENEKVSFVVSACQHVLLSHAQFGCHTCSEALVLSIPQSKLSFAIVLTAAALSIKQAFQTM